MHYFNHLYIPYWFNFQTKKKTPLKIVQLALTIKIIIKKMTEITENGAETTEAFHSINSCITNILSAGISHSVLITIPQKGESRNRIWSKAGHKI